MRIHYLFVLFLVGPLYSLGQSKAVLKFKGVHEQWQGGFTHVRIASTDSVVYDSVFDPHQSHILDTGNHHVAYYSGYGDTVHRYIRLRNGRSNTVRGVNKEEFMRMPQKRVITAALIDRDSAVMRIQIETRTSCDAGYNDQIWVYKKLGEIQCMVRRDVSLKDTASFFRTSLSIEDVWKLNSLEQAYKKSRPPCSSGFGGGKASYITLNLEGEESKLSSCRNDGLGMMEFLEETFGLNLDYL